MIAWVAARWPSPDATFDDGEPREGGGQLSVARELLAELDLLLVHLLTVEDVAAMLTLLVAPAGQGAVAVEAFRAYRASVDRRARSRLLKKDPRYRPFCV